MALGRLIRSTGGEKYWLIRIEGLPKIFVANNMISFLVPGTGSGNDGHGRVSGKHSQGNYDCWISYLADYVQYIHLHINRL